MGRRRKSRRWGMPKERREPASARLALLLLLVNVFIWAGLRSLDIVLVALLSALVALVGWIAGRKARRKVQRYEGRVHGDGMAQVGYWGNLIVFILSLLLFAYAVAMGILRGDLL